jgi:hypothetical protein
MSMARIYQHLHICSHMPGDIVVSAWEGAEHGVTFVVIETADDDYGRSIRIVISLRASDYPAFAQRVCEALAAPMTGEGSGTP